MSDQVNSEGITGSAGHARRAVMLGAAAAGAGAIAGVVGSAGTAMASEQSPAVKGILTPSRRVVVRLPPTPLNIDQAMKVVASVLGQAGCQGCFSGLDLVFTYENEFIVNVDGAVRPEI